MPYIPGVSLEGVREYGPHSPQVCGATLRAALADREWRYLDICVKSLRPGGVPYAYLCVECV